MSRRLYLLYGLRIAAGGELPLPLLPAGSEADLEVCYDGRSTQVLAAGQPARREWHAGQSGFYLRYINTHGGWFSFRYNDNSRTLHLAGTEDWEEIAALLTGLVAAILLRRRGQLVLHGSVVARGGELIAFLGPSGSGKSTLAGALMANGASLVSDDVVVPARRIGGFLAHAGHGRLSLLPDSLSALTPGGVSAASLRARTGGKFWLNAQAFSGEFPQCHARLREIYLLASRSAEHPRAGRVRLPVRDATIALTQQIYGIDWIAPPGTKELHDCAELAMEVPVYRLLRPPSFTTLDDTVRLVSQC